MRLRGPYRNPPGCSQAGEAGNIVPSFLLLERSDVSDMSDMSDVSDLLRQGVGLEGNLEAPDRLIGVWGRVIVRAGG